MPKQNMNINFQKSESQSKQNKNILIDFAVSLLSRDQYFHC